MLNKKCLPIGMAMAALFAQAANATIVQFQTVLGPFEVNLYDQSTPATVANFLAYVNARAYDNAVVHRVVGGFVAQGGGFTYKGSETLASVVQNAPVVNEPKFSNVRGNYRHGEARRQRQQRNQPVVHQCDRHSDPRYASAARSSRHSALSSTGSDHVFCLIFSRGTGSMPLARFAMAAP